MTPGHSRFDAPMTRTQNGDRDLGRMGFPREMAGIEAALHCGGDVARGGLSAGRQEEGTAPTARRRGLGVRKSQKSSIRP